VSEWLAVCRRTVVPFLLVCLTLHAGGTTILRNVWKHSPNDTASHQRRPASSVTPLTEPRISQFIQYYVATPYFHFPQLPNWKHTRSKNQGIHGWTPRCQVSPESGVVKWRSKNRGSTAGSDTLPQKSKQALRPTQSHMQKYQGSFLEIEPPGLEADCSPLSRARLEICGAIPQHPTVLHCAHRSRLIICQSTRCHIPDYNFSTHHRLSSHLKNIYKPTLRQFPKPLFECNQQ
jgi:hypothetical protein